MREAFEKAGVNVAESALAILAFDVLKASHRNPAMAIDRFADRVMADPTLLCELAKQMSRAQVMQVAMSYLQGRAAEMTGKPVTGGAGQSAAASQAIDDRPSTKHRDADRASRIEGVSRGSVDRPVGIAARTKIPSSSALRVAGNGIFARPIGSGTMTVGAVTRFDVVRIKRRSILDGTICDSLLELNWPDDETPLHKVASEDQVKAVFDRAYRSFDVLGAGHAVA